MKQFNMADLRTLLESVRGETRVKTKEEAIRSQFLQSAGEEIFTEHDWVMNKRTETLEIDTDGYYTAPSDFSMFNDYWFVTTNGTVKKADIGLTMDGTSVLLSGPTDASAVLHYYILFPDLIPGTKKALFPQPMLIAERAYVRLKTAYFPDETSEKEEARSLRMVRDLAQRGGSRPSFKLKGW
jgi:hypothetical protein